MNVNFENMYLLKLHNALLLFNENKKYYLQNKKEVCKYTHNISIPLPTAYISNILLGQNHSLLYLIA